MRFLKALPVCLLFFLAAAPGCPPQPVPTVLDLSGPSVGDMMAAPDMSNEYGVPACPINPDVDYSMNCDGWLTIAGLSCFRCPSVQGCLDARDVVYCAVGPGPGCQNDPACFYVTDGAPGAPGSSPKGAHGMTRKATRPIKKIPPKLPKPTKKAKPS